MAAFAVVAGVIAAQQIVLEDGTRLEVELEQPQVVFAVMRRSDVDLYVTSLHATPLEAAERMAADERALLPQGALQ